MIKCTWIEFDPRKILIPTWLAAQQAVLETLADSFHCPVLLNSEIDHPVIIITGIKLSKGKVIRVLKKINIARRKYNVGFQRTNNPPALFCRLNRWYTPLPKP